MSYSTSGSPPSSSPATRSLLHELQTGYRAAEELRRRFARSPGAEDAVAGILMSDVDLAEMIFSSFSNSLAIARSCCESSFSDPPRFASGDCGIGESGSVETSRIKDRRGCYKRRKRGQSWTTEGEAPNEDGHAWRKYGQKLILNSKFPRNYYRCTHKTDQNCQAIKQVQKVSDEPPLYRTTYAGNHTCKSPHRAPEIVIPSPSPDKSDSSILLSFDRASNPQISPFFPATAIKEELPSTQAVMDMMMMINQSTTSSEYPNYLSSSSPDPAATTVGTADYGGDVISVGTYSCSPSPRGLEIDDFMIDHHLELIQFD